MGGYNLHISTPYVSMDVRLVNDTSVSSSDYISLNLNNNCLRDDINIYKSYLTKFM